MDSRTRLAKTAKGREEIDQRRYKLASKVRTLLILVDGTRTIDDLTNDGKKLGAPDDAIDLLMREGFVAPVTGAAAGVTESAAGAADDGTAPTADEFTRFRAAQKFMNDTAVDNMGGLKKFTFTLKLERCSMRQDLADLVDEYEQSLTKSIGKDSAAVLVARLSVLLG
jgi:hypothetical protein